ncbi:unnamed protein product [Bursaphelenchus xylophilus]|uniref:(pine wood nematode) hypothetical protein n=1 Tax=Bursaphelenchus xylophilus TaxID=6326 RepID=A0A1I7RI83_BURXY|nr:unnamed protein product [Bursaphelenchus xylophilus]CAG9115088.1 unnamed protein product [Bursaphelenchus xylophilus]
MSFKCHLCVKHFTSNWELTEHFVAVSHQIKWKQDQTSKGIESPEQRCILCQFVCTDIPSYVTHVNSADHKIRLNSLRVRQSVLEDAGIQQPESEGSSYSFEIEMPKKSNKKAKPKPNPPRKDPPRKKSASGRQNPPNIPLPPPDLRMPQAPPFGAFFGHGLPVPPQMMSDPYARPLFYDHRDRFGPGYRESNPYPREGPFEDFGRRNSGDHRLVDDRRIKEEDRPHSRGSYRRNDYRESRFERFDDFRNRMDDRRERRDYREDDRRRDDRHHEDRSSRTSSRPPERSRSSRPSPERSRAQSKPPEQHKRIEPIARPGQIVQRNNSRPIPEPPSPITSPVQDKVSVANSELQFNNGNNSETSSITSTPAATNPTLLKNLKQEVLESQKRDKNPVKMVVPEKKGYEKRMPNSIQNLMNKKSQKMLATRMKQYTLGGESVLGATASQSSSESSDEDETSAVRKAIESIRRVGPKAPITGLEILQPATSTSAAASEAKKRKRLPDTVEEFVETHGNLPSKKKISQMADKMLKQFEQDRQREERARTSSNNSQSSQPVTKKALTHPLNQDDSSSDSDEDRKPVIDLRKPKQTRPEPPVPTDPTPTSDPAKPDPFAAMEQQVFGIDEETAEAIRKYEESKKNTTPQRPPIIVHQEQGSSNSVTVPPTQKRQRQRKLQLPNIAIDGQNHLEAMWNLAETETTLQEGLERLSREEEKCQALVENSMRKLESIRKQKEEQAKLVKDIQKNKKKLLSNRRR